jgi:hypothetical protein
VGPITIVFGAVLVLLGLGGYFGSDTQSMTALIPAFFGVPLALLGLLALKDSLRKHAMHLAAMVGLLGFLGAAGSLINKLQALMAIVCAVFVGLCVRSFIQARRSRARSTSEG